MKITIKALWYIIISAIILTIFVMVTAKVFAHGQDECLTDADGNTRLSNGGWVKVVEHLSGADLDGFVHGHRDQYYDKNGQGTGQAKGFFDIDFDNVDSDYFADCPTTRPPRQSSTPNPPSQSSSPAKATAKAESLPTRAKCLTEDMVKHQFRFDTGWNLFHYSTLRNDVRTVGDVYNRFYGVMWWKGFRVQHFDRDIQDWAEYDPLAEPIPLKTHTGIRIHHDVDTNGFHTGKGCPLMNDGQLVLQKGWNVVGFPQPVEGLSVLNALFDHTTVVFLRYEVDGETTEIRYDDDADDIPIEPWRSYMIRVGSNFTLDLSSPTPSAPRAHHVGTLATSWGAMKR